MNLDLIRSQSWGLNAGANTSSSGWASQLLQRREGVEEGAKCDGGWVRLPASLSPTGSNLEQTAPNVFIRL